jgi:hypothetical protein
MSREQSSYEVELTSGGENLQWLQLGTKPEVMFRSEPDVTLFMEFRTLLFAPFVPEQLL